MARYSSRFDDFVMLLLERPSGVTCREAAGELGTSRQTIYKYLDAARSRLGYRLIKEEDGRYRLPSRYRDETRHSFTLTADEIHDLLAAARAMGDVSQHLRSALGKMRQSMGGLAAEEFESPPVVYFADGDATSSQVYERAVRATRGHRILEVSYQPALGSTRRLRLRPHGLLAQSGHFYLIATPDREGGGDGSPTALRLRLDQIQAATILPERFAAEPLDLQEYAARAFGPFEPHSAPVQVRLRFSAEKAGFAQRTRRHRSQVCQQHADGSCTMTLYLPITDDLVWWVAGYGRHVEVLEPEELKLKVVDHARGILTANGAGTKARVRAGAGAGAEQGENVQRSPNGLTGKEQT
ncbi:MAG: helix-turn-helix transcriptional regulator [Bacillota bacterium]